MDGTTSFQALASKATSSYEGLLVRWQELLGQVSRGEVTPSAWEERLPEFYQAEGAEFYRRLASLSVEFLKDLSEVQTKSSDDFMRALLGDSVVAESSKPPLPTPPAAGSEAEEWGRWYQSMTAYLTEVNESALDRSQLLLEKVADGRLTPGSVQEFSRKFMNERALVLSRETGEVQMRFYESLLRLNQEFVENLCASLVDDQNVSSENSGAPLRIELVGDTTAPAKKALVAPLQRRVQKSRKPRTKPSKKSPPKKRKKKS